MIVAIMQPYFFPYIGYFQLISASDLFVLHDDVQYIKGGWINRNRILRDGKPVWITLPVRSAPHDLPINKRFYVSDPETRGRLLRRIEAAYRSAPGFGETYPLVEEIMNFAETNVALFNAHLIRRVAACLRIRVPFLSASDLAKNNRLTGEERVIEICRQLGATGYINPIGGKDLYRAERFSREGIELRFLEPQILAARDGAAPIPPRPLSIIDDLMREGEKEMGAALREYRIVGA